MSVEVVIQLGAILRSLSCSGDRFSRLSGERPSRRRIHRAEYGYRQVAGIKILGSLCSGGNRRSRSGTTCLKNCSAITRRFHRDRVRRSIHSGGRTHKGKPAHQRTHGAYLSDRVYDRHVSADRGCSWHTRRLARDHRRRTAALCRVPWLWSLRSFWPFRVINWRKPAQDSCVRLLFTSTELISSVSVHNHRKCSKSSPSSSVS